MKIAPRCEICRCWRKSNGECHDMSPLVVADTHTMNTPYGQEIMTDIVTVWPVTSPDECCGSFHVESTLISRVTNEFQVDTECDD